jgi:hypothetical protein
MRGDLLSDIAARRFNATPVADRQRFATRLTALRRIAKVAMSNAGRLATERTMFIMFERMSLRERRHREFRCPRCEGWPRLVKVNPRPQGSECLYECGCGVQIWDQAQVDA